MAFVSDLLGVQVLHMSDEELDVFNLFNNGLTFGIGGIDFGINILFVLPATQEQDDIEPWIILFDLHFQCNNEAYKPNNNKDKV